MSHHGCPERLSNRSKGFPEEGANQATMEVLVETLTGTAFEMTVSPSDTVFAIKSKIWRVEGIPVSQQHLVYNLRELEDASSLQALGISDGARLRLVLGMHGGPISTRRLPPPPEPWRDIERLLDTNRDDTDWCSSGSGCRVTVVVYREEGRVNMLRVRENPDGSYSPVSPLPNIHSHTLSIHDSTPNLDEGAGEGSTRAALAQNAVTMGKMLDLRRRMESLSVRRHATGEKAEIQKTRSEETLSVPSLLEDGECYSAFEAETGAWGRCGASTLPPLAPLAARASSDQDALHDAERVKLSDALAGSILVRGRPPLDMERAVLQPCTSEQLDTDVHDDDYGPLVCGDGRWRGRGWGAATGLLSASTGDLEALRHHRHVPQLHRHHNTETLHLSDDTPNRVGALAACPTRPRRGERGAGVGAAGELPAHTPPVDDLAAPAVEEEVKKKVRVRCGFCRKRLSIATVHVCRCGAMFCAPHRYAEVHGCAYDYKHRIVPTPHPPAPKLPKI